MTEPNPFAAAPDRQNLTEIMATIRTDPNLARRLIQSAGKQPADFGWDGEAVRLPRDSRR